MIILLKRILKTRCLVLFVSALLILSGTAQGQTQFESISVHAHIELPPLHAKERAPSTVLWLKPLSADAKLPAQPDAHYALVQKNRMFTPHILVIPVGSVVSFPNADPLFHNVFSLFNGKRFDLGLYEAGTTKEVVFSREGVSYIFCNIHPQMGAVILALATPFYAVGDSSGSFRIDGIPSGDYELHIWVDGVAQPSLDLLTRRVHVGAGMQSPLTLDARNVPRQPADHLNKFGLPYSHDPSPTY